MEAWSAGPSRELRSLTHPLDNSNDSQKVRGIAVGKPALRTTDLDMEQGAWSWGWELRSLSL